MYKHDVILKICAAFWFCIPTLLSADTSMQVDANATQQLENSPTSDSHFTELVLKENARLVLKNFRFLAVDRLIASEGAKIEFLPATDANSGGVGANGGAGQSVRLFVGSLTGHLIIGARGGDGGAGAIGRAGRQGATGARGADAKKLFFGMIYLGDGGSGSAGLPGENGEDGTNGGNGGAGGNVLVYYRDKADASDIFVDVSSGAAGLGGRGGIGGLGGVGGPGGSGIHSGRRGPQGVSGRSGNSGVSGHSGKPGEALVFQISPTLFSCLYLLNVQLQLNDPLTNADYDTCRSSADEKISDLPIVSNSQTIASQSDENIFYLMADGGAGANAPNEMSAGTSASSGSDGTMGGALTIVISKMPTQILATARGGSAGRGGDGASGSRGADGFDGRNQNLFSNATNGTNGRDGSAGGSGGNGGNGGAGGKIRFVKILGASEASGVWKNNIRYDVSGGHLGIGGGSGAGGRAGSGGRGGKRWDGHRMQDGKSGHDGANGANGKNGVDGALGSVEFSETTSFTNFIVDDFQRFVQAYSN